MGKPRRKSKVMHGEDLLSEIESVILVLENGKKCSFNIRDEVSIPDDANLWERELRRCSERTVFWEYQTERALYKVRRLESQLRRTEGALDPSYRRAFEYKEGAEYREGEIRAAIANDEDVTAVTRKLNIARKNYGYIKSVYHAVKNRGFVLDRLVRTAAPKPMV